MCLTLNMNILLLEVVCFSAIFYIVVYLIMTNCILLSGDNILTFSINIFLDTSIQREVEQENLIWQWFIGFLCVQGLILVFCISCALRWWVKCLLVKIWSSSAYSCINIIARDISVRCFNVNISKLLQKLSNDICFISIIFIPETELSGHTS